MAINSKQKGNTFERKIAKILSKRFSDITGVDVGFRRNADSGSFFGGKNLTRVKTHDTDKATFGDIICPTGFQFSVECKHYKDCPPLNAILQQNCSEWNKWIAQATQDAESAGTYIAIIVKYNRVDEFVITNKEPSKYNIRYNNMYVTTLDTFIQEENDYFFAPLLD